MVIKSFDKFMQTVDFVRGRLIGGEPLMYKRVDEVAALLLGYKIFGQLKVNTNGTIVRMKLNLKFLKTLEFF